VSEPDAARGDGAAQPPAGQDTDAGTPLTQQVGRVVLVVVALLFLVFALANAQYVTFAWVFGETKVVEVAGERVSGGVPLIVLLVASFGFGAVVAGLAMLRSGRRRRKVQLEGERKGERTGERKGEREGERTGSGEPSE